MEVGIWFLYLDRFNKSGTSKEALSVSDILNKLIPSKEMAKHKLFLNALAMSEENTLAMSEETTKC